MIEPTNEQIEEQRELRQSIHQLRKDGYQIQTFDGWLNQNSRNGRINGYSVTDYLRINGFKYCSVELAYYPDWDSPAEKALEAFHKFEGIDEEPTDLIYKFFYRAHSRCKVAVFYKAQSFAESN